MSRQLHDATILSDTTTLQSLIDDKCDVNGPRHKTSTVARPPDKLQMNLVVLVKGGTCILDAVLINDLISLNVLIDNGGIVNIANCNERYPLHQAIDNRFVDHVDALLSAGADVNIPGCACSFYYSSALPKHYKYPALSWIYTHKGTDKTTAIESCCRKENFAVYSEQEPEMMQIAFMILQYNPILNQTHNWPRVYHVRMSKKLPNLYTLLYVAGVKEVCLPFHEETHPRSLQDTARRAIRSCIHKALPYKSHLKAYVALHDILPAKMIRYLCYNLDEKYIK